ncbi:MAG: MBL fold metallo-hydrolase [Dehalococcoidia bacterium]|nr:MBL fold metallo-hydrolase [Dehalococcoidia bacterium]
MVLQLRLLGTGTPTPLLERAGACYLIECGDEVLLFDCGPGAVRRLLQAGVAPTQVTHLFLTHLHYDHCNDYSYLVLSRWDQGAGRIPDLAVCGPLGVGRMTSLLFDEDGVWGPDLEGRTRHGGSQAIYQRRGGVLPRQRPQPRVTEVQGGASVPGSDWQVTVAETRHCQPHLHSVAYRLDESDGSVVFSGDTAPTPRLTELARGADVLLHMCHFLNGEEGDSRMSDCCSGHLDAAQTAKDAGVCTLVLVHLTEQLLAPGLRERMCAEAAEVFDGTIIVGEDLLGVPLTTGPVVPAR